MSVNERKTNTIIRSVGFEFNKPIASADLNEAQSILLNNIIKYLNGNLSAGTAKFTIGEFSDNDSGITITGIKYCVTDYNSNVYYGYLNPSMNISYPNGLTSGKVYRLFGYWRAIEINPSTTVYVNGIRTNENQPSIAETTATNNILDPDLNEEVSNRKGLELTFIATANSTAPELSGWSEGVLISTMTVRSDNTTLLVNNDPASDIDNHLESEMPHMFTDKDSNTRYRYGLSVSNDHMIFNYEEVK